MASSSPSPDTLTGVLERIIFFNEENHYTIAELRPDAPKGPKKPAPAITEGDPAPSDARVTIVGNLPGTQVGETLKLSGQWTRHPQHGAQFKIESFKSELPASVYGIRKYLGSGLVPGIGKVYANKIVDAFGDDTFRVISDESKRLREVPGIGKTRAVAIKQAWEAQSMLRELLIFLQTYGVTAAQCTRLVNKYGQEAKQILINEPYRVARDIDGIGFKTADQIARNLGYANDASPRLDAGILYALETLQDEGHTAVLTEDLIQHCAQLLETDSTLLSARIDALVQGKDLIRHQTGLVRQETRQQESSSGTASSTLIQLPANDRAERKIAEVVLRLNKVASGLPPIKVDAAVVWAQDKAGFEFAVQQQSAVKNALNHKFTLLTGGPGTGKTTCLRALVDILRAKKVRVHLAAPTGRAAQRLAETTGGFASTIHRLLKFDPAKGGFTANESHPLATDFLIVDEASMLDVRLAAALFQAVPSRAHLLLVGDTDQLPSVGPGNVLKDLIATERAPVTRLNVIYRQQEQSQIVTTAHAINSGDASLPPAANDISGTQAWRDLTFIVAESPEDCLAKVIALCTQFIPEHYKWFHPINDVQILAPMHKGVCGVSNLNAQLQAA
ncbi:MAG TPA: AAA family ATPase, partial [Opitutaceae bacterium]|nr:AAA family ATPase [Opitutaceae bacterium]